MEYRVYGKFGKRCIRKFKTLEEAKRWCWCRDADYRIEWKYPEEAKPRKMYL